MGENQAKEFLRQIPGVDTVLEMDAVRDALSRHPRSIVLEAIREELDKVRKRILQTSGPYSALKPDELAQSVAQRADRLAAFTLLPVINTTGIVIHTNLGRSLLPEEALGRLQTICRGYNNLEYDLQKGERGSRYFHAESILLELTGAEAALVVNNNAGAVFLALNTLAAGREVVVSRGQLVEIGGSFRIPDVMKLERRDSKRSRHDQPHTPERLCVCHYRPDGYAYESPHQQLQDCRFYQGGIAR